MRRINRQWLSQKKNEIRVALFIVIPVIIVAVFILLKFGYSLAASTYDVYIKVDSMASIKKGTAVLIKGFELGRVMDVEPVYKPELHFLATLRIRRDIELDENCAALITAQGVIGDNVIEIQNPEKRSGPLRAGDVIEGIEMGKIDEIMKKVNVLLTEVTAIVSLYREVSTDSKTNLRSLITSLSGSMVNINNILSNSQRDIIDIITQMRDTSQNLNEVSREIKKNPMRFLFSGKKEDQKGETK